jgi:DNA-binding NtrC family response regulator/tetratricopeptide (TPR) repeat protein
VALLDEVLGNSPGLVGVRTQVEQLLRRQSGPRRLPPVLILGETGTGKGLLAKAIHSAGLRAAGPFVAVNCAAIPETLLEAELFGFEQGAFTDARHAKAGLFQTANGGTLFLDEIGLLPQSLQAKLLTVLEDRTVRRLGSTRSEPVDVWIISATSEDLKAGARRRGFREELYHRLAVVTLQLPALRERGPDILTLAEHFLARTCHDYGLAPKWLADDARAALLAYRWPGNVRELANLMERVALLTDLRQVTANVLKLRTPRDRPSPRLRDDYADPTSRTTSPAHVMGDVEQARIFEALRETRGNISRAADRLGVTRNILRYRLKKYGLGVSFGTTEPLAPAQPVSPMAEPTRAPRTAHVQWERRHVALLWVDLVAPAAEEPVPYVGPALDTVLQKIGSFGGQVEEVSPSDLVAVFGLDPVEDAPRRAAHAALAIQRAARAPGHPAESPTVRIGLHVGEVLVAWVGGAARVDHAAKREALRELATLMADAEAGVLVSETTRPFLERRFVLSPSAGADGTTGTVYRLVGLDQTGLGLGDRLTPFVGRDRELEQLADALEQARRRHGQVVAVVGEAGVGKSRLFWEFMESLRTRDTLIVVGSAASYGKSVPYLPVIDLLRKYFKIDPRDNSKTVKDRITEKMLALEQGLAPAVSAVLALLDLPIDDAQWQPLDPQQKRQRTLEAVKLLLLEESRRGPVVLVFEDLHWIDSETQAVLDTLVDSLPSQRVLLLVSYRPEYQPTWNRKTYYAQLRLDALSREDSQLLLDSLLGTQKAMASLKATLVERTGGNPFFLEESVRTLVETDVLTGDRGAYGLSRPVGDIRVPATVEAVLAARIERLSLEDKTLLQTAAVIGEDVPFSLLQAVAERSDDALRRSLSNLQAAEFLYEARLLPDLEYTFKHALTQQVAYRSVLQQRRRALHVRIGEAIEAAFPDRLTEHVERLAHHARRGELWDKALRYMRQAGQRAALRSAHREAVPCFDEALVALSHLPDSPQALELGIDLRLELRNSLMALGDTEREGVLISEARDRAEAIGDPRRLSLSLIYESNHLGMLGTPQSALASAERARSLGERLGDSMLQRQARYEQAKAWSTLGEYRRAAHYLRAIVEEAEGLGVSRGGPGMARVHSRTVLATNLVALGEFGEALVRAEEAVQIAEAAAYDFSVIHGHCVVGLVHARQGNVEMAIGPLERSRRISEARGIKIFFRTIASALGSAYSLSGRSREAVSLLEEAREWTAGQPLGGGALLASELGMAYLLLGRLADARNAAGEALEIARRRSERGVEAWVLLLWGEIYAGQEPPDIEHAEAPYAAAMERANELGMRPLLAHCHLGLGKLYRRTGKREQALKCLTTAATMYREMEMTYWLEKAEAEMKALA